MRKRVALLLVLVILIGSGLTGTDTISATSAAENTWTTKAALPISIDSAIGAATVNGKIYAMSLSFNYEYDPTTDKWTEKASMPTPRANFAIAVYQNKIYVIGAYEYSCANEVYDPATNTWEIKAPMPANRTYLSASVVGGKIHLFSWEGHDVYDVASDSWTAGKIPYAVIGKSVVVDNKIYVINWNITQIYDPKSDTWSFGAVMPIRLGSAAVCATTGMMAPKRIYVIGGSPEFLYYTDVTQIYDPISDTWVLGEPMPTARAGSTAASVDDRIYVIGGSIGMYSTSDVNEQYTPFGYGAADPSYDGTPPEITIISPENKIYHKTSIPIEFSVNEPVSWMQYKLDNENVTEISSNTTIAALSLGSHNLTVYAIDDAGNVGVSQTIQFEVAEDPFPALVVASVITVAVVGVGLLVYFKKRKHQPTV